jgi:hypothetical protein
VDFRLGGAPLTARGGGFPLFPSRATRVAALPTPSFFTFRDAAAFSAASSYHAITLPGDAATPGTWLVAVANARPTPLPAFLRRDALTGWGAVPGFAGASAPMLYTLRAALSSDPDDLCPLGCSGQGTCIAGACVCDAAAAAAPPPMPDASAASASSPAAAPAAASDGDAAGDHAGWAGPACDAPVVPIKSGFDTEGALSAGAFAHYWVRCLLRRSVGAALGAGCCLRACVACGCACADAF